MVHPPLRLDLALALALLPPLRFIVVVVSLRRLGDHPGSRPGSRRGNRHSNRYGDRHGNRPDNLDRPGESSFGGFLLLCSALCMW